MHSPLSSYTRQTELLHSDDSQFMDRRSQLAGQQAQNRVKWTSEENKRYCLFLSKNLLIFDSEELRKKSRIFSILSAFMKTRITSQVKSHHQKMMKRHRDVRNILKYFQRKLGEIFTQEPQTVILKEKKEVQLQTETEYFSQLMPSRSEASTEKADEPQEEFLKIDRIEDFINFQSWFDDL